MMDNMRFFFTTIFFLCAFTTVTLAQVTNDECDTAIPIDEVERYCSEVGEFSNQGATPSSFGAADCFGDANNDVWFTFIPTKTTVTVSVIGAARNNRGGSLVRPEVALYTGSCDGTITQLRCGSDITGNNIIEITRGGLAVGVVHRIRVQGRAGSTGTFQLCINNFNPPVEPGQDCPEASVLCNKEPFNVEKVFGPGADPTEANDAECFFNVAAPGENIESSSVWFAWTADNDGTLTFTLTPNNAGDDLDFVVYELPNGVRDCRDKIVLRCMASGGFGAGVCQGPTGLDNNSEDVGEPGGCFERRQDNFLAPLVMEEGKSYALMVNNFSDTESGFGIEFGGDGEFVGPQADFTTDQPDQTVCVGGDITFTDASSFALGAITSWNWNFGAEASITEASGPGPHEVSYRSSGLKSIVLSVESEQGCVVTKIGTILVECCDDHFSLDGNVTEVQCVGDQNGTIDLMVDNPYGPYEYRWTNAATTEDLSDLGVGEYTVTISDAALCDTTATFEVTVDSVDIDTLLTPPTCNGGMDGAITLETSGGNPPFEFNWEGQGFTTENSLTNLSVGDYNVTVRDANDCAFDFTIPLRELELVLDPTVQAIDPPSCAGFDDGSIQVIIDNGLGPFEYNWNDGRGFQDDNSLTGIPEGVYQVEVRDANLCRGNFTFDMEAPPPLSLAFDVMSTSCNGNSDGEVAAVVSGGVGNYTYRWDGGQPDSVLTQIPAGTYQVTVLDANNCEIDGQVVVEEPEVVDVEVVDIVDVLCNGESTGAVTVMGIGGTPPFEFSVGDVFQSSPTLTGLPAGTFTITLIDSQGCSETVQATVNEPAPLTVDAGEDQSIKLGFNTRLRAFPNDPNVVYEWSPATTLSCVDCPNPAAAPVNTTVYKIAVTNEQGCLALDSLEVTVIEDRPVYIPNAFSPNGDGVNDFFTLFGGPAAAEILDLKIFDRWGELIFDKQNIPLNQESAGWDGTFNGKELSSAVFVYMAEVAFIDNKTILFKGDITLLR